MAMKKPRKRVVRKIQRRSYLLLSRDEDVFWNNVIEGFKKLLSPAFKK
jgi:hypothetical protein